MVNALKTQCIFIGSRQLCSRIPEHVVVNFDGTDISPSRHVTTLGLHMDQFMSFDTHVNEINKKKVMDILIYINRISSYLDNKSRIIVVQTLVLSRINYLFFWGGGGTTNSSPISKVQKLQNFAARIAVDGIKKFDHVSPAYRGLMWLKIQ